MVKAENIVVGISGHKGSGKTTLLTYFLYFEITKKIKEGCFCNYKLNFPFKWLNAYEMIDNIQMFSNHVIGIDELHEYADSRQSSALQNKRISDFFLQSRHTSSNVYYTTQYFDQIDKRISRITDIKIYVDNPKIDADNDNIADTFKFVMYDKRYDKFYQKCFYAKPIFDLFDSTYRINPFIVTKEKQKEILNRMAQKNDEMLKE